MSEKKQAVIALYQENARLWDERRGASPLLERPYLDWLMENADPRLQILDLGCGTGRPIGEYLIANGFSVTGVDAAAAMIGLARERFPTHTWIVGDMCDPLEMEKLGSGFGAIIAWDSFFHLAPHQQRFLFPLFRAAMAQTGPLLFTTGPEQGEAWGKLNGKPLYHSSLSPQEYRELLAKNGFRVDKFTPVDAGCGDHTVWQCFVTD